MTTIERPLADSNLVTAIATDFTQPVYLVHLHFDEGDQYLSTGKQIVFNSKTYVEGQVRVGSFSWSPEGDQQGTITIFNENDAATALVLGRRLADVEIEIYVTYVLSDGSNTDPVQLVQGVLGGARISPSGADIDVLGTSNRTGYVPNRYFTRREGFRWLPRAGTLITWENEKFLLEADSE